MSDQFGRSAADVIEAEAGGLYHHAALLYDLGSHLEGAVQTYEDGDDLEQDLAARCQYLLTFVEALSLRLDGSLTFDRVCRRCGGRGRSTGEDPCLDCGGDGKQARDGAS